MHEPRPYRGITKDGKWVKGDLVRSSDGRFAIIPPMKIFPDLLWKKITMQSVVEVIPESVGQSTGMKDKNDAETFEGDMVEFGTSLKKEKAIIEFQVHCYNAGFYPSESANASYYWEVIGTVHDHLLKRGE